MPDRTKVLRESNEILRFKTILIHSSPKIESVFPEKVPDTPFFQKCIRRFSRFK